MVGEAGELVAAHDGVGLDELLPEQLDDLLVGLEEREGFLDARRQLLLALVLLRGRTRGRLQLELCGDAEEARGEERR